MLKNTCELHGTGPKMRALTPLDTYLSKRGDDFYYACLKTPAAKAFPAKVIQALWEWVVQISEASKDPEIAQKKLAWCRQDIDSIYLGNPTHPITQALVPIVQACQIRQSQLAALIEASTLTLSTQLFETQASLNQHYQHLGGLRLTLLSQVLTPHLVHPAHPAQEKALHTLGIAQEIIRHLQFFKKHLMHQRLYLPLETFSDGEQGAYAFLSNPGPSPVITALFQHQAQLALDLFSAESHLETHIHPIIFNDLKLSRQMLGYLIKEQFPVLDQPPLLSPIRRLWAVV